jgi:hypothetical protein
MSTATITKAELAAQARREYIENTAPIAIDMDGDRAFAMVPSQDNSQCYKVFFVEPQGEVPHAVSCSCPDHQFRHRACKHFEIVNNYYAGIYASMKPAPIAIGNAEMDALVAELERDFALVEEVAPVVSPVVAPKAKKVRRSSVNVELVESLQVAEGVKVRKSRKGALVVKCPVIEAEVSSDCPAVVVEMAA